MFILDEKIVKTHQWQILKSADAFRIFWSSKMQVVDYLQGVYKLYPHHLLQPRTKDKKK